MLDGLGPPVAQDPSLHDRREVGDRGDVMQLRHTAALHTPPIETSCMGPTTLGLALTMPHPADARESACGTRVLDLPAPSLVTTIPRGDNFAAEQRAVCSPVRIPAAVLHVWSCPALLSQPRCAARAPARRVAIEADHPG